MGRSTWKGRDWPSYECREEQRRAATCEICTWAHGLELGMRGF